MLDPNRLFSSDPTERALAAELYSAVRDLPILSPHGHTDPAWFALNEPFPNPTALFLTPDHYIFRMLYSQGIPLEDLGIPDAHGKASNVDPRQVWRLFAANYFLFRGTPTRLWLDHTFEKLFGLTSLLSAETADLFYNSIDHALKAPEFRPRTLFDRFRIEVLSTTDSPLSTLEHHAQIRASGWSGRVLPTFRPDPVIDADFNNFHDSLDQLAQLTGEHTATYPGYLNALRNRRAFFKANGATATDHGHLTAATADLDPAKPPLSTIASAPAAPAPAMCNSSRHRCSPRWPP